MSYIRKVLDPGQLLRRDPVSWDTAKIVVDTSLRRTQDRLSGLSPHVTSNCKYCPIVFRPAELLALGRLEYLIITKEGLVGYNRQSARTEDITRREVGGSPGVTKKENIYV